MNAIGADRLVRISYIFPNDQAGQAFYQHLSALLSEAPGSRYEQDSLLLAVLYPPEGLPVTTLTLAALDYPAVILEMKSPLRVQAGQFSLSSPAAGPSSTAPVSGIQREGHSNCLPVETLRRRFEGHIRRVDHTGVEFPAGQGEPVEQQDWDGLLQSLSCAANLYRYPSGEAWPFVLPANADEFHTDIFTFAAARTPKLELTYGYTRVPTLQFHLDTSLPRPEVEARLPAPYGFTLPGVETFRSVYLAHPWLGLDIRCDLTFFTGEELNSWDSGEWLVKEGGRINQYLRSYAFILWA